MWRQFNQIVLYLMALTALTLLFLLATELDRDYRNPSGSYHRGSCLLIKTEEHSFERQRIRIGDSPQTYHERIPVHTYALLNGTEPTSYYKTLVMDFVRSPGIHDYFCYGQTVCRCYYDDRDIPSTLSFTQPYNLGWPVWVYLIVFILSLTILGILG
jgi:hypothetical protein